MEIRHRFNVSFRNDIETGKCRLETNEHKPARIICWDRMDKNLNDNIIALVMEDTRENGMCFNEKGDNPLGAYLEVVFDMPDITELEGLMLSALIDANGLPIEGMRVCAKGYVPILEEYFYDKFLRNDPVKQKIKKVIEKYAGKAFNSKTGHIKKGQPYQVLWDALQEVMDCVNISHVITK